MDKYSDYVAGWLLITDYIPDIDKANLDFLAYLRQIWLVMDPTYTSGNPLWSAELHDYIDANMPAVIDHLTEKYALPVNLFSQFIVWFHAFMNQEWDKHREERDNAMKEELRLRSEQSRQKALFESKRLESAERWGREVKRKTAAAMAQILDSLWNAKKSLQIVSWTTSAIQQTHGALAQNLNGITHTASFMLDLASRVPQASASVDFNNSSTSDTTP